MGTFIGFLASWTSSLPDVKFKSYQESISPTFYTNLLHAQISKEQKIQSSCQSFFALLGSAGAKFWWNWPEISTYAAESVDIDEWSKLYVGLNFIDVLHTAFTLADPESVKRCWWLDCIFFTLSGSTSVKASHKMLVKLTLDYLKEKRECFCESLKVVNVVESRSNFHRLEKRHSKDCENEHDEKEKKGDVDKRRKSHDQWKEKGSNPLRTFDQTQDSTYFCDSHLKVKK